MQRKVSFTEGEHYHLYSRGVEKRKIFLNKKDYERFMALLFIMNQPDQFKMENFLQGAKKDIRKIFGEKREKTLVSIISYCLMPNHFHIIVHEHTEGGISKFMSKLLTAYSMYFNTKYERSGPLLTRPFRSQHIEDDSYYLHLFSYVHLNPLSIIESSWKDGGIKNINSAKKFLENYSYSSYVDFLNLNRPESVILDKVLMPETLQELDFDMEEYQRLFQEERSSLE